MICGIRFQRQQIGSKSGQARFVTLCKRSNPYGQLLCGMLQVTGAVYTLYTHSMAAYGRSTGAYNTPVITQWLGQRLCYCLVQTIGYG